MDLYQQELMDHYRYPRNRGVLESADIVTESLNPSCGDSVSFSIKITDTKVTDIKFQGSGCVISQATSSMLTELCMDKTLDQLDALDKNTIVALVGIPLGPTRLRCALLSLEALHQGIHEYRTR